MTGNTPSKAELVQKIAALTTKVINSTNSIAIKQAPPAAAVLAAAAVATTSHGMAAVEKLIDHAKKHGANQFAQRTKLLELHSAWRQLKWYFFRKNYNRASMMGRNEGTKNILKFTNRVSWDINLIAKYGQTDAKTLKVAYETYQATIQTRKWHKTINICGTVCTIAPLKGPRQHCLPIERTTRSP